MALVQDELVVKVRAETSGMTKEFKKLRKALSKAFNQKQTTKDFKKLEEELADIRRLGMVDPFRNWGKSIEGIEKKLKSVNAKTLKQTIKEIKKLKLELPSKRFESWRSKEIERLQGLRKKGYTYDTDIDKSTKNYLKSKYNKEPYGEEGLYEKYNSWRSFTTNYGRIKDNMSKVLAQGGASDISQIQARIQAINEELSDSWSKELIRTGTKSPRIDALKEEQARLEDLIAHYEELEAELEFAKGGASFFSYSDKKKFGEMDKDAEEYKSNLKEAVEEEEKAREKGEKKRNSRLGKYLKQIGKSFFSQILGAMAIRRFISGILNQIKQGTQNLYEWSRYNKKEWADIFDKSKSMSVALGNAMAVVKFYLSAWFEKMGTSLKDILIDLMNLLSKAIAWYNGEKTYVQANKDIMARWSDNIAQSRQLIQGFDRLNIWNGNDNTLPKDMFTEKTFESEYNIGNLWGMIKEFFSGPVWNFLKTTLIAVWDIIKTAFTPVKMIFEDIWKGLKALWGNLKLWWNGVTTEDEGENGEIITRQVEPGFKHALKEWFDTKVKGWWTGTIVPFFTNLWNEKLKPWFMEAWEKIKKWFDESIEPFMTKLADTLAKWWQNRKQVTNYKIEDWVYDKTGAVIDIEDTLRQFKRLMPWNWGKDLSEEVSFNAAGGVYTTPSLGVVGEASTRNNPELVTPTALLDDRLQANNRELLSAFNGMMNGVISAVNGISMEIKIGDDVIAKSASRGNEAYYKQMGRPLIR